MNEITKFFYYVTGGASVLGMAAFNRFGDPGLSGPINLLLGATIIYMMWYVIGNLIFVMLFIKHREDIMELEAKNEAWAKRLSNRIFTAHMIAIILTLSMLGYLVFIVMKIEMQGKVYNKVNYEQFSEKHEL